MFLSTHKFRFDQYGLANVSEKDDVELCSDGETREKEERKTTVKLGLLSDSSIGPRRD